MSKIIIGIDPDSIKHGIAVYEDGKLISLDCLSLMGLMGFLSSLHENYGLLTDVVEIHIEDVCAMNAVFRQKQTKNNNVNMKMANSIGKCQQSQIELERMIVRFQLVAIKHKISKQWKKDKSQFEKVTGWSGRSNEDTRSAAWFGYLGLTK